MRRSTRFRDEVAKVFDKLVADFSLTGRCAGSCTHGRGDHALVIRAEVVKGLGVEEQVNLQLRARASSTLTLSSIECAATTHTNDRMNAAANFMFSNP